MKIQVTLFLSEQTRTLELKGRLGLAMTQLVDADDNGFTPISNSPFRWRGYVFDLRELGFPIDTVMQLHEGSYPGLHTRYVLACGAEVQQLGCEVLT